MSDTRASQAHGPNRAPRYKTGLYWFSNDLRLQDNPLLLKASMEVERLVCVYVVDPAWFKPIAFGQKYMGLKRWRFLSQTLQDLDRALEPLGQSLHTVFAPAAEAIAQCITVFDVNVIYRSECAGLYERRHWNVLQKRYAMLSFEQARSHTLFDCSELPFKLADIPPTFTQFRKTVEPIGELPLAPGIASLPAIPKGQLLLKPLPPIEPLPNKTLDKFVGGESAALKHLKQVFTSDLPVHYKQRRNELTGWENSTKFAPWLANGSVSARQILAGLQKFERQQGASDSSYWISFELLWREYFQWYAHARGAKLFAFKGIKATPPHNSYYAERFMRWCMGNTPYPLVNACMAELNETGYLSNRGRQIVASCLVNELDLDWRYGAAYFQQQLLDYDVAVNWGNWQYLAGVGADPRGLRRFDLDKQAKLYDPNQEYVAKWAPGKPSATIDSVGINDWPIVPTDS